MKTAEVSTGSRNRLSATSGGSRFSKAVWSVVAKDLRAEVRTRSALGSVILFSVTSTIAVSFGLAAWGSNAEVAAALLWLVIYFSAMSGLSRSFVREEESHTADLLRLVAPPNAVYLGKLGVNLLEMAAVEIVTVPLFLTLAGCHVKNWVEFVAVLVLGTVGLAVCATTSAAIVSKATGKGALYAVISFPLLVPVLALAIHATGLAIAGVPTAVTGTDLRLLAYYSGTVLVASLMLFRFVWES